MGIAQTGIVILAVAAAVSVVVYSLWTGITPLPSTRRARTKLLDLVPTGRGAIYELGSGWGGLAFALADRFPERTVVGFELSPVPWAFSRLRALLRPRRNLTLRYADFRRASLSDAEVLVCYLFPAGMQALAKQLEDQARVGTSVVSNSFAIRDWQPLEVEELGDAYATRIYLYRIPLRLSLAEAAAR